MWQSAVLLLPLCATSPSAVRYDGHALVRALPQSAAELAELFAIADDVWTEHIRPGPIDLRVAPDAMPRLRASGIAYEIRIPDLQAAIDDERARLAEGPTQAPAWFSEFRDLAAIEAYVDTLASRRPDLVEVETIGTSLQARPIRAVRIGVPAHGKTALLLTGTMHAREWLSPMVVMCIADAIVTSAGSDDRIDDILAAVDLHVVPVLNPDGYVVSWQSDRYWRKNTRDGHGVDLNRNFGYAWGGAGASADPWAENYHGTGPFSEPESAALRDLALLHPELVAHVDVHAYANLVIYPWGYGYEPAPDAALLHGLADEMSDAMLAATGAWYQPIQGADFYPAAGAVDDWSYGERDMMAFTIELRGNDFVVSPQLIAPACEETLEATLVLAEWAAAQADIDPPDADDGIGPDGDRPDPEPPATDDAGTTSGADETGIDLDGDAIDPIAEDDGDPDALPPGFGLRRSDAGACACTTQRDDARSWPPASPVAILLAILFALAGRRRGVTGRSTATTGRENPASCEARGSRARP